VGQEHQIITQAQMAVVLFLQLSILLVAVAVVLGVILKMVLVTE
jgi:1,4-dihydroxy-2-naphthoate octaprenyltransferase